MYDEFDGEDLDDDEADSGVSMPCPHCSATIYDDSERCPHCGMYLSREDRPLRPPWWVLMGVCVALVIVARWIVGF